MSPWVERMTDGFAVLRRIRNWPFLAKIDPFLSWSADFSKFFSWKILFIFILLLFFNRKKIISAKKSTFRPYYQAYDSSVSTHRKIMKLLKRVFRVCLIGPILTNKWSKLGHCVPKMAQNEDLSDFLTFSRGWNYLK